MRRRHDPVIFRADTRISVHSPSKVCPSQPCLLTRWSTVSLVGGTTKAANLRAERDGVGHREIVLILTGHVPGDINRAGNEVGKDILDLRVVIPI